MTWYQNYPHSAYWPEPIERFYQATGGQPSGETLACAQSAPSQLIRHPVHDGRDELTAAALGHRDLDGGDVWRLPSNGVRPDGTRAATVFTLSQRGSGHPVR